MNRLANLLLIITLASACRPGNTTNSTPPADSEKITIKVSDGIGTGYDDFKNLGYQKGDKIPDLSLFTPDGLAFSVKEALATGKPLILISGSYTCDISRSNIPDANMLGAKYNEHVNIFHVYTVDAHPTDKACPYSPDKQMRLPTANMTNNIQAKQPKSYGERRELAKKWQDENGIVIPVLVDKPGNDYWMTFGQAPNTAYLIAPDGEVYYKQVWFKYQDFDMAISNLLRSISKDVM